jgi:hypothetical protein
MNGRIKGLRGKSGKKNRKTAVFIPLCGVITQKYGIFFRKIAANALIMAKYTV